MRKDSPQHIKELSRELRKCQTEAESLLWQAVRGGRLNGFKFRRQYSFGRYIVDFYCSKARLVVEIDGKVHNEINQYEYDRIRENEIISYGIQLLRFSNE